MSIQLRVYRDPGQIEVFLNLKRKDGIYEKQIAIVDTGAQVSLLPDSFMKLLDYRLSERSGYIVDQAGIAHQSFQVIEAYIYVFLEDANGNSTDTSEIRVWFANTKAVLLGMANMLDQAVLHLDMPNLTGYLEFANG